MINTDLQKKNEFTQFYSHINLFTCTNLLLRTFFLLVCLFFFSKGYAQSCVPTWEAKSLLERPGGYVTGRGSSPDTAALAYAAEIRIYYPYIVEAPVKQPPELFGGDDVYLVVAGPPDYLGNVRPYINGYVAARYIGCVVPPEPPPTDSPPLGCASGAGGFFSCPGNSPPTGTPDGPMQNDGAPSPPDLPSPNPSIPNVDSDSAGGNDGSRSGAGAAGSNSCKRADAVGDPILASTGNVYTSEQDYVSPVGLNFVRSYNSGTAAWVHNFQLRIIANESQADVIRPDGRIYSFVGSGLGNWTSNETIVEKLTKLSPAYIGDSAWKFTTATGTVELYDLNGMPKTITWRGGRSMSFTTNGRLILAAVDNYGRRIQFGYDSQNRLINIVTPEGSRIAYAYDVKGRLANVSYPDNSVRNYLYENTILPLLLTSIVDETGNRIVNWTYDGRGRAISGTMPLGANSVQLSYGSSTGTGKTTQVTDALGSQRTLGFSSIAGRNVFSGQSQPCTNCFGDAANKLVDPISGMLTEISDYAGVKSLFINDNARKLVLSITQAAGRPEAKTTSTQWHPTFRLPILVTEAGKSTAYTYDSVGNLLTRTETDTATGQNRIWAWTSDGQSLVQTSTDPKGEITRYGYDAQGNRVSAKNPLNHETSYRYDAAGRVTLEVAPNGLQTAYSYDLRGKLLSAAVGSPAAGIETTRYSYHPTGQLATVTMPNGLKASYTYDAAQRLVRVDDDRGDTITYTLDVMGNRVQEVVRDASGTLALLTARTINNLNRIAAIQGAEGQVTSIGFDANAQAISQTDPLNQTTRQTLDALRRPIATIFADNSSAQQSWNQLDHLTEVKDPKNVTTSYQRNVWGEPVAENSPDSGTTTYQRDASGNIVRMVDAKGNSTQVSRDALGRPVEVIRINSTTATTNAANPNPTPQTTRYTWDQGSPGSQIGYLAKVEDTSGTTTFERDEFGRVTRKTQAVNDNPSNPSTYTTAYSYVAGQLASITYPSGLKVFYSRDSSGQIIGLSTQQPGKNKAVTPFLSSLTYTALGQPKAWTWASGDSAARTFDPEGRITTSELASYTFDAASRITDITQNLWAARTVTTGEGTTAQTATSLYQTPFAWQATYDSRNRLIGFNRPGQQTSYSYDANSNRLNASVATTSDSDIDGFYEPEDFTATSAQALNVDTTSNRLQGFNLTFTKTRQNANGKAVTSTASSSVNYQVDAAGNLTSDGARQFDYDNANRLAQVKLQQNGEEAAIDYLHNAQGQRVFKSEPKAESYQPNETRLGTEFTTWLKKNFGWLFDKAQLSASIGTAYVYADEEARLPTWAILGEYDNGSARGAGRTEYIWLPTDDGNAIPVGMSRNGKLFAVHTDHLGTPRLLTNDQNTPVWQWPYSAFGNNKPTGILKATINPRAAVTNSPELLKATNPAAEFNLRFPGQYADDEAGVFYNYYRNYQPNQGRYTQADPVGLGGGLNRFGYVDQDPLNWTDPTGERKLAEICVLLACLLNDRRPPPPPPPRPPIIQPTKNPPEKNC